MNKCPFHSGVLWKIFQKLQFKPKTYVTFSEIKSQVGSVLKNTRKQIDYSDISWYIELLQQDEEKLSQLKQDIQMYEKLELLISMQWTDVFDVNELISLSEEYKKTWLFQEYKWFVWQAFLPTLEKILKNSENVLLESNSQKWDLGFCVNEVQQIFLQIFRENILQALQNDKDFEFLLNLSPWENGYLVKNIFEKWFLLWVENTAFYIWELLQKWVSQEDIIPILQANSSWMIDIAKSAKLNFLLQDATWSTFVFDKKNALKFNITQNHVSEIIWSEQICYSGCPMLYEKGKQAWTPLLVDFEILTAKLILHYLDC